MFKLIIRTPYETIFSSEVISLYFSAGDGDMQIFENHASITAGINFSPIIIEEPDKEENFLARNGIFLFNNDKNEALMLISTCQKKSEVDHFTVKQYLEFLEKQLEKGKDLSEFQILYLQNERLAIEQQVEEG